MPNTIKVKQSAVAGKVPTTAQLQLGELAVNTTDGKLYTKKNVSGTESVVEIGAASASSVTSFSAGTTGLTPSTGTTGAVTLGGTLAVANGGTGGTTQATARTGLGLGTAATAASTDFAAAAHVGAGGTAHAAATTSVAGFMSSADKTKLDGIASGATANTGTVTSVALSLPAIFSVSGSPVSTSGTLTAALASQAANVVLASPSGAIGTPTFRVLVAADIPVLDAAKITTGTFASARLPTTADTNARVAVSRNGTLVGTRREINFIPGTNVTLSVVDDPTNEEIDVTINASGDGGGVTSFSAGTTGLTPSTGTTGAVTLAGTLAVANGGTGGTTAATARTNLGAASSGLVTASGLLVSNARILGRTTASPGAVEELSSVPVSLGGTGATTAATARTNLSAAGSGAITSSGLTMTSARLLGRTTASTGAVEELSSVPVSLGGTGATTAATARTNLGLGSSDNVSFATVTGTTIVANGGSGSGRFAGPTTGGCFFEAFSTEAAIKFGSAKTFSFSMQADRNVVLYDGGTVLWQTNTAASDGRLKNVLGSVTDGLNTIAQLNPVWFSWKEDTVFADGGVVRPGFVAQEVAAVIPHAATLAGPPGSSENQRTYLLQKEEIVPHLVSAVQELKTIVDAQRQTISALETRLTALETR